MLFLSAFTGFGAVVLSLGLMTMALTIQMRAKPIEQVEAFTPFDSRILAPTPPIESPSETEETQPSPETSYVEARTEQPPAKPSEEGKPAEPAQPREQPKTEPTQPPQQPPPPEPQAPEPQAPASQAPGEEKKEPQKGAEKPKEEPQAVAATAS